MPIRIERDPNTQSNNNTPPRRRRNSGGGGGGGLIAFAPMLIGLLRKKPKLLIIVAVIGGLLYFTGMLDGFLGGGDNIPGPVNDNESSISNEYSRGNKYDEKKYVNTEIFAALADNIKNPLPNKVSLLKYAPQRLNQGKQGSCVGWASSYAARTILYAKETGQSANNVRFSPSFLYNQIALAGCQGTYISEAMKSLQSVGDLPLSQFSYNENSCSKKPTGMEKNTASRYRIKGYNRLTKNGDKHSTDLLAIKQNLAKGAPVVFGMMVGGSFMQGMQGKKVWIPTSADYNQRGFGGHAMCLIGYDDYLEGGSFQIMNSWGTGWGQNGIGWVRYDDFDRFTKEAYGLYPMGSADKANSTKLNMKFGLVNNSTGKNIAFQYVSGITCKTKTPIAKGTKFKIESTNSIECYTYVIGQETNKTSYVLFPYTKKHSPYCGITGTRLFPNDHSLVADNVGNKDYMAIIVSKTPLDYNKLNAMVSKASGATFEDKIMQVIKSEMIQGVRYNTTSSTIDVNCDTRGKNILAVVLEIDKR